MSAEATILAKRQAVSRLVIDIRNRPYVPSAIGRKKVTLEAFRFSTAPKRRSIFAKHKRTLFCVPRLFNFPQYSLSFDFSPKPDRSIKPECFLKFRWSEFLLPKYWR